MTTTVWTLGHRTNAAKMGRGRYATSGELTNNDTSFCPIKGYLLCETGPDHTSRYECVTADASRCHDDDSHRRRGLDMDVTLQDMTFTIVPPSKASRTEAGYCHNNHSALCHGNHQVSPSSYIGRTSSLLANVQVYQTDQ